MSQLVGRRVLASALVGCLLTIGAAACSEQPSVCVTDGKPGLAIAVGARANSPAPAVTGEVQAAIDQAVQPDKGITVIRVDGNPTIACKLTFDPHAVNEIAKADELRRFKDAVSAELRAAQALEPEANPLEALSRAAAAAGPNGTVILLDSGLQTVTPLDFREAGLIDADPSAVAKELARGRHLPNLRERAVILAGIGYTAPPQMALDERRRSRLIAMWTEIARTAGAASVVVEPAPNTGKSVGGVPKVSPVNVPPLDNIHIGCNTESVLSNDGKVGFVPDTTIFIDSTAARQTLKEYAQWLAQNPEAHASLVGTIAHYGFDEGDGGLARARALRVREVLIELGAGADQISARGDGWGPFPSKDASPSPAFDQRNRRVVVTITC